MASTDSDDDILANSLVLARCIANQKRKLHSRVVNSKNWNNFTTCDVSL